MIGWGWTHCSVCRGIGYIITFRKFTYRSRFRRHATHASLPVIRTCEICNGDGVYQEDFKCAS